MEIFYPKFRFWTKTTNFDVLFQSFPKTGQNSVFWTKIEILNFDLFKPFFSKGFDCNQNCDLFF
mgnify:CR=1 FL=1